MRRVLQALSRLTAAAVLGATIALAADAGAQASPPPVDIPIQNLQQQTEVWCWAAVAQQIIAHAAGQQQTPEQCALVAMANNAQPVACCGGFNPACVRTGSLEQIQGLIAHFGGRWSTQQPPANPMILYRTLASGRPIILHVRSGAMSSHVVVLRGMSFVPGPRGPVPVLHINDPLSFFTQPVPFERLVPMWINAIVVEPGSAPASRPLPQHGAGRRADVDAAPTPERRIPPSETGTCRATCRADFSSCVDEIESVDDCLETRTARCMRACTGGFGNPEDVCEERLCNPDRGSNVTWRPVCERARTREVRKCRDRRDSCARECDED